MTLKKLILFSLTSGLSFLAYVVTLAPTITWENNGADSGDLATAVAVNGVPHPSGYPTYLLLGELVTLGASGDIAYRLNGMSAVFAALTVGLLALLIFETLPTDENETNRRVKWVISGVPALLFAFSSLFWSQAVITEVYALNAFFTVILLYLAIKIQPNNQYWLILIVALMVGLSMGNHLSILLLLPTLVLSANIKWQWSVLLTAFIGFGIGLSVYLIIPIRAATHPPLNWGNAVTLSEFWWLISGQLYRPFVFGLPLSAIPLRLFGIFQLLMSTFLGIGVLIGGWGLIKRKNDSPKLVYASMVGVGFISIYAIGYNTTDSFIYLIPTLALFTVWVGWGGYHLIQSVPKSFETTSLIIIILLPFLAFILNFSEQRFRQDDTAITYAQQTLNQTPNRAIILTERDDQTFALWYVHYALGVRPDVIIINENLLPYAWYRESLQYQQIDIVVFAESQQPITTRAVLAIYNQHRPIYLAP